MRSRSISVPAVRFAALLLVVALFASACASPIGVKRVDSRVVQRELTQSILNSRDLSDPTRNVLRLANLESDFSKRPADVIELVHRLLLEDAQRGEVVSARTLISLAELSFSHAEKTRDRRYFLAAAFYAWLFLFPNNAAVAPDPFDPRLRLAADLYNRSVTLAFVDQISDKVRLEAETIPLPVGELEISLDESSLVWGDRKLVDFVPVSELEVRGLRNRYRWRGLGAPFAAVLEPVAPDDRRDAYLSPRLRLPVAALLRFERNEEMIETGVVRARLEIHAAPDGETVEIEGRTVPLEMEPTSSIASMMTDRNPLWRDLKRFFAGDLAQARDGLVSLDPYRPGRIPVVLVHGTFSSAYTWAEVVNDLTNDPEIRSRFQFWVFDYNTGNPVAYSAWLLRRAIDDLVTSLDPDGLDPALQRTIVVGHSQGGLLTKLMAVDAGLSLWQLLSDKPPAEAELDPESREILEGSLLVDPLPMVERVVFIATPHRGSYMANRSIAKWIGRFARSPIAVADAVVELATDDAEAQSRRELARTSGSIDNMSPGNDFLAALVEQPVVPQITSHSIIAVRGDPDLEDAGDRRKASDGVVMYESARIDGVSSQLVVPSGHSCLNHPWTIGELRRILLSHVGLERRGPEELNLP
ncbi:MAG: alpha/beta hydrolase [bacterium]|nr:alpha/beta hydrolase [bacterium]